MENKKNKNLPTPSAYPLVLNLPPPPTPPPLFLQPPNLKAESNRMLKSFGLQDIFN